MRELLFATGNRGKISEAQQAMQPLGIAIKPCSIDFDEPRSDDLRAIALAKVEQAKGTLYAPFIVHDSAFYVEALNGFPGTFVNFALSTIGVEGILKLMDGVEDRRCHFGAVLAYWDGEKTHLFEAKREGVIANALMAQEKEKQYSALWRIFQPNGQRATLAELDDEELQAFRESGFTVYKQLANFLQGEKLD